MSTDITVNSANSGAITAALKTPTADIKYVPHAPHTKYPPEQRDVPSPRTTSPSFNSSRRPRSSLNNILTASHSPPASTFPRLRYDESNHSVDKPGDPSKRAFTYMVLTGGRIIYASALRLAVLKFLLSMSASADVLALASLEVDLSKIEVGQTVTVKWRGKPVFIRRRTEGEIEKEVAVDVGSLRDPQADVDRATDPQWMVLVGVCTHLGCVPISNAGDYNGWFCPCHGSHYDASGRIRKGPAPYNLEVPEYKFMDGDKMVVG